MQVRILTIQHDERFYAEVLTIGDDEHVFHTTNTLQSGQDAYHAAYTWAENNEHKVFTAANGQQCA